MCETCFLTLYFTEIMSLANIYFGLIPQFLVFTH